MRNVKLRLAIFGVFGALSAQTMATGLVSLPTAGFAVSGGTSAYTLCNTTGNYGSGVATAPTTGANNTCAVFPANANTSPVTGAAPNDFTLKQSRSTAITGNGGEALATLNERVFRNGANTECIYGKYLSMSTTTTFDYNASRAGNNTIEVNDFAFGGFSSTPTVQAGYYYPTGSGSVVYRVGRAFTSVQTHSNGAGGLGTGYLNQPLVPTPALGAVEINGVGQVLTPPGPTPTAAQQTADIRTNWVDFTVDVTGGPDEDGAGAGPGSSEPFSPWFYVRASCTATAAADLANSVILRQTGQETQPYVTIKRTGWAASGANASF